MLRLLKATLNSWNGLRAAAGEQAFRQELVVLVLALPLGYIIAADTWQWAILIAALLLVLAIELVNTAVEKLCDHVQPRQHPDIGRIKDMGSAAVGVAIAIAGLVWLVALAEWLSLI